MQTGNYEIFCWKKYFFTNLLMMPQTYDEHAFLQDMFSIKGATQK